MSANLVIEEAVGPDTDIVAVTTIHLLGADTHSATSEPTPLSRFSDGSPFYSYERWIRLRFDGPFSKITQVRFWTTDFNVDEDWRLIYGIAQSYRRPINSQSPTAVNGLLVADPGESHPNILNAVNLTDGLLGVTVGYCPWIVLQAIYVGSVGPDDMSVPPLPLSFAWREC